LRGEEVLSLIEVEKQPVFVCLLMPFFALCGDLGNRFLLFGRRLISRIEGLVGLDERKRDMQQFAGTASNFHRLACCSQAVVVPFEHGMELITAVYAFEIIQPLVPKGNSINDERGSTQRTGEPDDESHYLCLILPHRSYDD